jgi:Uncharacterised protein family (UPF0175)
MLKQIKHLLNQTQLQRSDRNQCSNGSSFCLIKRNVREAIAGLDGAIAGLKGVLRCGREDAIAQRSTPKNKPALIGIAASQQETDMQITIELPDDIANRLTQQAGNLSEKALKSLAIDSYRAELLSHSEVERILNLSWQEVETLLNNANTYRRYICENSSQGEETLRSLENCPTIAETFDEIRQICIEENFELEIPPRQDRPNPFIADDIRIMLKT